MWGEHALRVFVHNALRRIFHPEREEVMGGCRKLHIYGFGQP